MPQKISITGTSSRSTIMQGINYLYTATGTKLRKQTRIDHQISKTFDYAGRFVYSDVNGDNTELAYLMANHGRIVMHEDGSSSYEYSLKDHLGNTRITFDEDMNILQEDAYYPYGMNIKGLSYNNSCSENKYKYNGKRCTERSRSELQDEFGLDWYDYGARMYDASIGRWHVSDPKTEEREWLSPFNYVQNNPLGRIDPNGARDHVFDDRPDQRDEDFKNRVKNYIANRIQTTAYNLLRSAIKSIKNKINDIIENTTLETKLEGSVSEELGVTYNIKGEAGGGAAIKLNKTTITAKSETELHTGKTEVDIVTEKNENPSLNLVAQAKGYGVEYTIDPNLNSEATVTTGTGVPFTQSETTISNMNNSTTISTGAAIGGKVPLMITPGGVLHVSLDFSLKLVYSKEND